LLGSGGCESGRRLLRRPGQPVAASGHVGPP
jgi:hypothetical protein